MEKNETMRIGIASCLLGNKVRFDGGHKFDPWVVNTLGNYVDFVPVCPEVECGMPVPREPMRLVGNPASPRLVTTKTYLDKTEQMQSWSAKRVVELEKENLCGYIFKRASPSSGMERVSVYKDVDPATVKNVGAPDKRGVGLFANAFMQHFPLLPVEEEGRLHDPKLRENFIERIFTMHRWRTVLSDGFTTGKLVEFHSRHKLLLMAHSVEFYRSMGKLVAAAASMEPAEIQRQYQQQLMTAMQHKCTIKKHCNVLQHCMGYFKKVLTADEKQELIEVIDTYRENLVPLVVPLTLINHYVRKYGEGYLEKQYYLQPHPVELKLRNHV